MAGKLTITEFNNYGDPAMTTPREPSIGVTTVNIGEVSDTLNSDTRLVALYSDLPCKFQFVVDSEEPDADGATPMKEEYEIIRVVHMGGKVRVAVFPAD